MKSSAAYSAAASIAFFSASLAQDKPPGWNVQAKWQFEIQTPLDTSQKLVPEADIWEIDLWHAWNNPDIIQTLKDKTIICYFNMGAVQPDDCDFTDWYPKLWNGPWYYDANFDPEHPNEDNRYCERYENFTDDSILKRMQTRLDKAAKIGCDGVDPDNIDISDFTWGNGEEIDEKVLAASLEKFIDYAHSLNTTRHLPLMIGQKNARNMTKYLKDKFDFAVLEDCAKNGWCHEYAPYLTDGKPVIAIEYPGSLQNAQDEKYGCNLNGYDPSKDPEVCAPISDPPVMEKLSRVLKLNFDEFGLNGCTQYCDSGAILTPTNEDGTVCLHKFVEECKKDDAFGKELKKNCCCGGCKH